jgi:hypothetical protein
MGMTALPVDGWNRQAINNLGVARHTSPVEMRPETEAHETIRVLVQGADDGLAVSISLGSFNASRL